MKPQKNKSKKQTYKSDTWLPILFNSMALYDVSFVIYIVTKENQINIVAKSLHTFNLINLNELMLFFPRVCSVYHSCSIQYTWLDFKIQIPPVYPFTFRNSSMNQLILQYGAPLLEFYFHCN